MRYRQANLSVIESALSNVQAASQGRIPVERLVQQCSAQIEADKSGRVPSHGMDDSDAEVTNYAKRQGVSINNWIVKHLSSQSSPAGMQQELSNLQATLQQMHDKLTGTAH
jgi:hypothetical protein